MVSWKRRLRRFEAWLAALLLGPQAARAIGVAILAFALLGLAILIGSKFCQDLYKDGAEAFAWGRQFLGGYGRHPPLTGWIAGLWYRVFPAEDWASFLLSRLMTATTLAGIYGLALRTFDRRRAALIVLAMMLYPLFVGAKSDRFNNYQVLLALMPWLLWAFLAAYDKCSAAAGALFGAFAAATALTIYAAALPLFAVALAAIVHPRRGRFLASPAPYVAIVVFAALITPHLVWLIRWDFPPLHWVAAQLDTSGSLRDTLRMVPDQLGLIAIPFAGMALALLPWRLAPPGKAPAPIRTDAWLMLIVAAVLIIVPPLVALPLRIRLKVEWGDALYFIVPIALIALLPRLAVRRRAVARLAVATAVLVTFYAAAAPIFAWAIFVTYPGYDAFAPTSELAREVTRLWRERFSTPLPIVAGTFGLAAPVAFYSPDHPRMFADSPDQPRVFAADQPAFSPWIDYPADLRRNGFVGICNNFDPGCDAYLRRLAPDGEALDLTLTREVAGRKATPWIFHLRIARPR